METNILKRIFFDNHHHWKAFAEKHRKHICPVVFKEIEKIRDFGNPKIGFRILVCEGCHDLKVVPYRVRDAFA
jgi:hypothetical protein